MSKSEDKKELKEAPSQFSGFCPITPVPKGRPRFNSITRRTYTPAETREYENAVRSWMQAVYGTSTAPMDGALSARYEFVLEKPSNAAKKKVFCDKKPDIDNYVKAFQDAMDFKMKHGELALGVIANDSRIACLETVKRYAAEGEQTGTFFTITRTLSQMMITSPNLTQSMKQALCSTMPTMETTQLAGMRKNPDTEHIFLVLAGETREDVDKLIAVIEQKFPNAKKLSVI